MNPRLVRRIAALSLLLASVAPAVPGPVLAQQAPPIVTPCQQPQEPRLPAGDLRGKAGEPVLVEVRRELRDLEFPFSLSTEVQEAPAGARLDVTAEGHTLRLEAGTPGRYRIRVRGIQQISAG